MFSTFKHISLCKCT